MLIKKIAQSNHFESLIKDNVMVSLFKQKVSDNAIYWKEGGRYRDDKDNFLYTYLGYVLIKGNKTPLPNQVYSFKLVISFNYGDKDFIQKANVYLYLNKKRSPLGEGEVNIGEWAFTDPRVINSSLGSFVKSEFNLDILLPHEESVPETQGNLKQVDGKKVLDGIRLTRNKSIDYGDAKSIHVYIYPVETAFSNKEFVTAYKITNLEKQTTEGERVKFTGELREAVKQMNDLISRAKSNKYVDKNSKMDIYIPEDANPNNYDFVLRKYKDMENDESNIVEDSNEDTIHQNIPDIFGGKNNAMKLAQDYSGYYSGDIPDYAVQNLGTGSVDASQVSSMFGKTDDAIRLVNQFDSSLLSTVSFIFNFSKGGAYGVYLSELDRAIKTKALENKLEGLGYRVEPDDKGMLLAYPTKEDRTPEQIQSDIDKIYADLESKGGTAFGINMNSVLNAAKQDAMATQSQDPNIWEWMAVLHLGGTIVHEAVHAKGHHDEGPSENAESAFMTWALPKINEQYFKSLESQGKEELFAPITVGTQKRSAQKKSWYKKAQYNNYVPGSFTKPRGSDLSGRSGQYTPQEGMADWGMLMQQDQHVSLEERLGRGSMSDLPADLDQAHDSYEEQLRKYTREDMRFAPDATMEDMLSLDYDEENTPYKSIEELLDEKRPKPLIIPLDKSASSTGLIKTATSFGWYNNLEISDGNTIPGLSDRVMAWEDGEEDFAWTDKEIRGQSRYNPEYDIKGFYYRWIDPRLQPQLFDDMTRDYSGTHPAKRFASKVDIDPALIKIFNILAVAKRMINGGDIKATRFIMSEDILPVIETTLASKPKVNIMLKYLGEDKLSKDDVYSVWLYSDEVEESKIRMAEDVFAKGGEINEELFEELFSIKSKRERAVKNILKNVKKICKEYNIEDIYVVGEYPRAIINNDAFSVIENMDFSSMHPNQCIKVGCLLVEKLGIKNAKLYPKTTTLSFLYNGVKVDFKGNFSPFEIKKMMKEEGITVNPLNIDVYNRDFTINMLTYDINKDDILDVCGESVKDINGKIIKTYFDPETICKQNPLTIIRALQFKMEGYEIEPELERAMILNGNLLFDGRYSDERIIMIREVVEAGNKGLASELFKEYGLNKIKEY